MAPEVMCRQNHGVAADYFALGILCYELMIGRRPYLGKSRKEIRDKILAEQITIKKSDIPPNWSIEAADFINKTIQRKPANRLGLNGPQEVKQHVWLKDIDWSSLLNHTAEAPFIPPPKPPVKIKEEEVKKEEEEREENEILLRRNSIQNLFNGYFYDVE